MTIGIVQQKFVATGDGGHSSETATFDSPPTEGNTLIIQIGTSSGGVVALVPDGTWSHVADGSASACALSVFAKVAGAGESSTITVPLFAGRTETVMLISEVNGSLSVVSAHDGTGGGGSTVVTIPAVTPTAGAETLLMLAIASSLSYAVTVQPTGYTAGPGGGGPTLLSTWSQHAASASGSYGGTVTYANGVVAGSVQIWFTPLVGTPGVVIEFDDTFIDVTGDIKEWTITRGESPELTGGSTAGSATIVLINDPDDDYNPENTGGPYYGSLHDGPRVWIGVHQDGTVTPDALKTVYGLFAGRITDLSPMPVGGATVAPTVELVCEDPLGWYARTKVTLADSTTRSQYDLRVATLDGIGDLGGRALEVEPTTLPLSSADGFALNILDAINAANGTRHFAKPADNSTDWYNYTTVRRTSRLDGVAEASANASAEHVTSTSGWRVSADGVINQQKASVEPIDFPARIVVWQPDALPITVLSATPQTLWLEFGDYVRDAQVEVDSTGSALTATLTPFGHTAKLVLTSSGTTVIQRLDVAGYQVQRGSIESVTIDDLTSQALARGVRAGADLSGDYLGTLTSAKGFAQHIVWRFGNALYRPTMTVLNWFPEMFDLDLCDRISLSIAELSISDRIFDIVGLTLHSDLAALNAHGDPVVLHDATYVLQESRVQTPTSWFTLDISDMDDPDHLAY